MASLPRQSLVRRCKSVLSISKHKNQSVIIVRDSSQKKALVFSVQLFATVNSEDVEMITASSKVKNDINITRVMSRCSDHFTFVWDELTSSS